jgi:iron-sulfur cluster assembly protein
VLQVTDSAAEAVKAIVEQAEVGATGGLRIAVDEADESVELGVEEAATADDTVIDLEGARVFLDEPSARALAEMVLDANAHDDHFHFELLEQES